jgi:hypothetical protein
VFESFNNGLAASVDRIDADAASYVGGRGVRVARFADATARDTATTGAIAEEGTLCYLKSDDKLYLYTGAGWVVVGSQ